MFDTTTGALRITLDGNAPYLVGQLAFSADGTKLASQGPVTGLVRVWAIDVDDLLEIARRNVTRTLTESECWQFLHRPCPS